MGSNPKLKKWQHQISLFSAVVGTALSSRASGEGPEVEDDSCHPKKFFDVHFEIFYFLREIFAKDNCHLRCSDDSL